MYADKVKCSENKNEITDDDVNDSGFSGVPTLFHHALAKLSFKVKANFTEWKDAATNTTTKWEVTITSFKIDSLYTKGSCALALNADGKTWNKPVTTVGTTDYNVWTVSDPASITAAQELVDAAVYPDGVKLTTEAKDLTPAAGFVMPQVLAAGAQKVKIVARIKTTLSNGRTIEENFEGDEYLLYGVDRAFLLSHPEIPHWTREDMIKAVHEAGGAVMQAHPFRDRDYIKKIHLYPEDVDGIEGINTANTANDNLAALCYALHFGLMIQAGSDTHFKYAIDDVNGGILYEKPITSERDYAERLLRREKPRIFFPDGLFAGMGGIKIKLPVEIRKNGAWVNLSIDEIEAWVQAAGANFGDAKEQPEGIVRKIVDEL